MEEKDKHILKSFVKRCEEYREKMLSVKRKSDEWEGIARRLYYNATESGALTDFQKEWFLNEILEAQGELKKEDNPNRH